MKRHQHLRRRPLPSRSDAPSAPLRRTRTSKPPLQLPATCRVVTLAFAKRNFCILLGEVERGTVFFIKLRGKGRSAGVLLIHVTNWELETP